MPDFSAKSEAAVDLEEAAARLGIDQEAMRKALQRGLLAGFQTPDGGWKVFLEPHEPHDLQEPMPEPAPPEAPPSPVRPPAEPAPTAAPTIPAEAAAPAAQPQPAQLQPAQHDLPAEIARLRDRLQRREEEIREKDQLIADLARSLARLSQTAIDRLPRDEPPARPVGDAQAVPQTGAPYEEAIDNIRHTLRLVRNYLVQQKRQFPDSE